MKDDDYLKLLALCELPVELHCLIVEYLHHSFDVGDEFVTLNPYLPVFMTAIVDEIEDDCYRFHVLKPAKAHFSVRRDSPLVWHRSDIPDTVEFFDTWDNKGYTRDLMVPLKVEAEEHGIRQPIESRDIAEGTVQYLRVVSLYFSAAEGDLERALTLETVYRRQLHVLDDVAE